MAAAEVAIGGLIVLNSLPPAVAVLRSRRLRQLLMYQLVASMSLGEMLAGAVSVVLGSMKLLQVPVSSWACAVGNHLRLAAGLSTAVTFFCISLERYVTVIHGLRYYDILTDGRRRLLLAASWVFAAVCFCVGVALRLLQPQSVDSRGMNCLPSEAITPNLRLMGAILSLLIYFGNAAVNIFVGIIAIRQAKRIRVMEATIRNHNRMHLQNRGFIAIAVLSLMYCVFVLPNAVNIIVQSLVKVPQTTNNITGFIRLVGMIIDGWSLTLLCPMLREEYVNMFRDLSEKHNILSRAPVRQTTPDIIRSPGGPFITSTKSNSQVRDNNGIVTLESNLLFAISLPSLPNAPSCSGVRVNSAATPEQNTDGYRSKKARGMSLDPSQSHVASLSRSFVGAPSTSNLPPAPPVRPNSLPCSPDTTTEWK